MATPADKKPDADAPAPVVAAAPVDPKTPMSQRDPVPLGAATGKPVMALHLINGGDDFAKRGGASVGTMFVPVDEDRETLFKMGAVRDLTDAEKALYKATKNDADEDLVG